MAHSNLIECSRKKGLIVLILSTGFCVFLSLSVLSSLLFFYKVFPEAGMVLHSQCSNPTPSWNGKIFDLQLWKNSFENDPKYNTYHDTTADRRLQALRATERDFTSRLLKGNRSKKRRGGRVSAPANNVTSPSESLSIKPNSAFRTFLSNTVNDYNEYPLILWGSHHKTGTYLAQKIFAVMCAQMKWCCVYHVTRDSVHSIRKSLQSEPVHLLGHTQWIWLPEELGIPYKFIHLYRHPYKKIISGYRYHMEGAEPWCKQVLYYNRSCEFSQRVAQLQRREVEKEQQINSLTSTKKSKRRRKKKKQQQLESSRERESVQEVSRSDVQSFCKSVHLCEPCCRREHELASVAAQLESLSPVSSEQHLQELSTAGHMHFEGDRRYALRRGPEYQFICSNLMQINASVMETLNTVSMADGLRVEAAIDYYESLRMARIVNHTRSDPASLNIDLDRFMGNFESTVEAILSFLNLPISEEVRASLDQSMQFYDVSNSYYYRLFMSNPLTNHVDTNRAATQKDLMELILNDTDITQLYAPILEMMH